MTEAATRSAPQPESSSGSVACSGTGSHLRVVEGQMSAIECRERTSEPRAEVHGAGSLVGEIEAHEGSGGQRQHVRWACQEIGLAGGRQQGDRPARPVKGDRTCHRHTAAAEKTRNTKPRTNDHPKASVDIAPDKPTTSDCMESAIPLSMQNSAPKASVIWHGHEFFITSEIGVWACCATYSAAVSPSAGAY